jgi:hypothetical protein
MLMKLSVRMQAWIILGTFFGLAFISNPSAWLRDWPREAGELRPHPDFISFYAAGTLIREDPSHLYDEEKQARVQEQITGEATPTNGPGFLPFSYPPITAFLFAPFTLLSYSAAFMAMFCLNIFLAGIGLHVMAKRLSLSADLSSLIVLCFAAALSTYQTVSNGQLSFLVFLLYIFVIADILAGKASAGVWAGLLAIKPTSLPLVGLWFLVKREWKALGYAVSIGGALVVVSFALIGFGSIGGFLEMSSKMASGEYLTVHTLHMTNLRALSLFLGLGDGLWAFVSAIVVLLLCWKSQKTDETSCAALLLAVVLVTPHIHVQDLNLLWIVVALVARRRALVTATFRRVLLGATLLTTAVLYAAMTNNFYPPIVLLGVVFFFIFLNLVIRNGGTVSDGAENNVANSLS